MLTTRDSIHREVCEVERFIESLDRRTASDCKKEKRDDVAKAR
jgi:hypothetical protein